MGYRRLFILRKDLNLSAGKLAAMVGHCAESYWTNLIKDNIHAITNIDKNGFTENYISSFSLDSGIYEEYISGIFTKTICEAKNLNQLMKAKTIAEELGMVEGKDFSIIADCCLTELEPEYIDENGVGRTIVGIAFKPLPDEVAHKISKKYQLYK